MASRFFFAGSLHTTPVTVSSVDDSRMAPQNAAVGNNMAVIGLAEAGRPAAALTFSSPREARLVLRSGDLLTAVRKAFAPSARTGGPAKVTAIRVGKASPSTLTLKDAAAADSIVLTSSLYGLRANAIRVKIEAGTVRGKRVTTRIDNTAFSADNVGRDAFTIRYTGASAAANIDVTGTNLVLRAGAVGSLVVIDTIAFAAAPTVQQLVDRINATAGFVATVAGGSGLTKTLNGLDGVLATDVKTAAVTVKADLAAIVAWFNANAEQLVTATRASGATAVPANTLTDRYLAGATDPTPVLQDWMDAIDVLDSEDVAHIVPLTSDPAVHSAVNAHVVFMSSAGRRERRAYAGPDLGLTVDQVKLLPRTFSSDRLTLCWPGHYDADLDTGERVLYAPWMTAVHVAGGFAGLTPGNTMTNKSISVLGLEVNPSFPADTDVLIENGVTTFESAPDGIKCVRAISTWVENDNYNRVEISTGVATDYVVRAVRTALDPLRGQKGSPQLVSRAKSITETTLMQLARPEPGGPGIIVGDEANPAYRNISVSLAGDVITVNFECSPVVPANFIGLGVAVVPYQGTLAA
jgi:hypothetical protein